MLNLQTLAATAEVDDQTLSELLEWARTQIPDATESHVDLLARHELLHLIHARQNGAGYGNVESPLAKLDPGAGPHTDLISESKLRAKIADDISAERDVMLARAQSPEERAWASTFYNHCARLATTGQPWLG